MSSIDHPGVSHARVLACEGCRQRKRKCDTRKPVCTLCGQLGTQCTYPRFSIKPGPKRKPPRKDVPQRGYATSTTQQFSPHDTSGPPLESMASIGATGRSGQHNNNGCDSSMRGSNWSNDSTMCNRSPMISSEPPLAAANALPLSENKIDDLLNGRSDNFTRIQSPAQHSRPDLLLPPRDVINILVDVFFVAVQPQFRLLHRPSLNQQIQDPSYLLNGDSILLLNAIFALSARYSDDIRVELFDMSLIKILDPKARQTNICYQGRGHYERGKGFAQLANKLLQDKVSKDRTQCGPGDVDEQSIQMLQAAALLSYAEIGAGVSRRAHYMISMCARMSYDFGLHEVDRDEYRNTCRIAATPVEDDWIKKEELRRLWWCIWDLDNFICTATCRPRMMRTYKCQTKLPVNDKDWFDGYKVPSTFLPGDLQRLTQSLKSSPLSSAMAYRIVSCHLLSTLVDVLDSESLDDISNSISAIEDCATAWKENLPKTFRHGMDPQQLLEQSDTLSDSIPMYIEYELIRLLLGKARMAEDATADTVSKYCQSFSDKMLHTSGIQDENPPISTGAQAFCEALSASNAICDIVRDWPTNSIIHTCPFIIGGLWAPAAIQLLSKTFAGPGRDLAEKATVSLSSLVMTIEHMAEYWGLCRNILVCFRAYEKRMTNDSSLLDENCGDDPFPFPAKRIVSFPIIADKELILSRRWLGCEPPQAIRGFSDNQLESALDAAPLYVDIRSAVPGDHNCFDFQMQIDGGIYDLDYSWME